MFVCAASNTELATKSYAGEPVFDMFAKHFKTAAFLDQPISFAFAGETTPCLAAAQLARKPALQSVTDPRSITHFPPTRLKWLGALCIVVHKQRSL